MSTATPIVRHRRRMLAWALLVAVALLLVTTTAAPGSFDGRHLLVVYALAALVLEAEWHPRAS
ncbi:hypothetical protein ACX80U_12225 [Arthrobacter sp. TmT3-37]